MPMRCLTAALLFSVSLHLSIALGKQPALASEEEGDWTHNFSSTSKLSGTAQFVLGGNRFGGTARQRVNSNSDTFGASTFNYDVQLNIDTSFNGGDLLRTTLRAGNFDGNGNSFGGGGPSSQSVLEVAFQEEAGPNILGIERLYYQFPIGDFTFTIGGRVEQDDMLAIWPSIYPSSTVLDVLTYGGAPVAYNMNLGAGAGLWWQKNGLAISANYVDSNMQVGDTSNRGVNSGTVQIGYSAEQWGMAAIYSHIRNNNDLFLYGTRFTSNSFTRPGTTSAFGLSAYWQPADKSWIPSISAGWGASSTTYNNHANASGLMSSSQSWSVGLQWETMLGGQHAWGMAVGQAPFATRLKGGASPKDSNTLWEWWYSLQLTDTIAITPGLFFLSRPLGADTPANKSFQQLGGMIKTSFYF
jgi:hypothetical protein